MIEARISLTLPSETKLKLIKLAEQSNMSLNAYIGALMSEAAETCPIVKMHKVVMREKESKDDEELLSFPTRDKKIEIVY